MSTKAYIARVRRPGELEFVLSIKNSHPEYLGVLLKSHYTELNKVKDMLEGGDIKGFHKDVENIDRVTATGNYTSRIVPDYQFWDMFYVHQIDYMYIFENGNWMILDKQSKKIEI